MWRIHRFPTRPSNGAKHYSLVLEFDLMSPVCLVPNNLFCEKLKQMHRLNDDHSQLTTAKDEKPMTEISVRQSRDTFFMNIFFKTQYAKKLSTYSKWKTFNPNRFQQILVQVKLLERNYIKGTLVTA